MSVFSVIFPRAADRGSRCPRWHFRSLVMSRPRRSALTLMSALMVLTSGAQAATPDAGGIYLGATRVIYNESAGGSSIRVINSSTLPFLIQTWVDSYQGDGGYEQAPALAKNTFVATPPLYRQDKGENTVRLLRAASSFPADRESVLWLNVKSIPATAKPKAGTNYVQFAFNNRIKLFYRPADLPGKPGDAYRALTFSRSGTTLTAHNPSAYHVTLNVLKLNGVPIKGADARMVPPLGTQTWTLPAGMDGKQLNYVAVNDFGGLTDPVNTAIR